MKSNLTENDAQWIDALQEAHTALEAMADGDTAAPVLADLYLANKRLDELEDAIIDEWLAEQTERLIRPY